MRPNMRITKPAIPTITQKSPMPSSCAAGR